MISTDQNQRDHQSPKSHMEAKRARKIPAGQNPESASVKPGSATSKRYSVYNTMSTTRSSHHISKSSYSKAQSLHKFLHNRVYDQPFKLGSREPKSSSSATGVLSGAASLGIGIPAQVQGALLNKHGPGFTAMQLSVTRRGSVCDEDIALEVEVFKGNGEGCDDPIGYDFRAGTVEADLMGIGTQFGRN